MSSIYENKLCYFCDEIYPKCFLISIKGKKEGVCCHCENKLPIKYDQEENGECCVCINETILVKLPTCHHKLCIGCCKTIYFGSSTIERPLHWREIIDKIPVWPYTINEEDENDPEQKKYNEYCEYQNIYFETNKKSYEELLEIRNSVMLDRPDWMNTENFLNYENRSLRFSTEFVKLDKEWKEYNKNKTKGNKTCPLCRTKPI